MIKNRGSSSSSRTLIRKKQKVGTPGQTGKGVQFEAAVLPVTLATLADGTSGGSEIEGIDTFSYDDVSNLATVTPLAPKLAVSRTRVDSGGDSPKQSEQRSPQAYVGKGKKRAVEQQVALAEGTNVGEDYESGAAKRRKKRKQEAEAAAATITTAETAAGSPKVPPGPKENQTDSNSRNGHVAAIAEGRTGVGTQELAGGEGGDVDEAVAAVADPRSALSSSKAQERGEKANRTATAKSARKMPRYPQVALERPTGNAKARNMSDVLKIAVAAECKGLIRKRGKEPACKAAVQACKDVGLYILKHAKKICVDLDPKPRVDLEEVRKALAEEGQRHHAQIAEEEQLWAIEEQKCLALAERNKRAQARVKAHDDRLAHGHVPSLTGTEDLRALLERLDEDEEEGSSPEPFSDGAETSKRVNTQIVASTNDMIINATAIGRCLQEMGSGVADAQETKERLAQVFRQVCLKNYPNVDDPKAGIAAMLK